MSLVMSCVAPSPLLVRKDTLDLLCFRIFLYCLLAFFLAEWESILRSTRAACIFAVRFPRERLYQLFARILLSGPGIAERARKRIHTSHAHSGPFGRRLAHHAITLPGRDHVNIVNIIELISGEELIAFAPFHF